MSRDDSALLVVDVQERLIRLIPGHPRIVWNVRRLIDGAKTLNVRVAATEQYPKGLGPTTTELADRLGEIPDKLTFSCGGCPEIFEAWRDSGIFKVLVAGIETHVCVQQTALDLIAMQMQPIIAVDAVGSRRQLDHEVALSRMQSACAVITTVESVIFHLLGKSGTDLFRRVLPLVRWADWARPPLASPAIRTRAVPSSRMVQTENSLSTTTSWRTIGGSPPGAGVALGVGEGVGRPSGSVVAHESRTIEQMENSIGPRSAERLMMIRGRDTSRR